MNKTYKPYDLTDRLTQTALIKCAVEHKETKKLVQIRGFKIVAGEVMVLLRGEFLKAITAQELVDNYVYLNTGEPCGIAIGESHE